MDAENIFRHLAELVLRHRMQVSNYFVNFFYSVYLNWEKVCISGLAEVLSQQIKKSWVHKSQIRKVSHLRKIPISNKLFKFANLRICDLRNLFAYRP